MASLDQEQATYNDFKITISNLPSSQKDIKLFPISQDDVIREVCDDFGISVTNIIDTLENITEKGTKYFIAFKGHVRENFERKFFDLGKKKYYQIQIDRQKLKDSDKSPKKKGNRNWNLHLSSNIEELQSTLVLENQIKFLEEKLQLFEEKMSNLEKIVIKQSNTMNSVEIGLSKLYREIKDE